MAREGEKESTCLNYKSASQWYTIREKGEGGRVLKTLPRATHAGKM